MKGDEKVNISKEKIERCMVNKGLTPPKLAELAGVSQEGIARAKRRGTCSLSTAIKLCSALECTIEELMPDTESEVRS